MESSGRWGVFEAGITGENFAAAVQDPLFPQYWYAARIPGATRNVTVWEWLADERIVVAYWFFPFPQTPWQFLATIAGGPI